MFFGRSKVKQIKVMGWQNLMRCNFLFDPIDKILDAAEAAERQTLSATSRAATRMVSER